MEQQLVSDGDWSVAGDVCTLESSVRHGCRDGEVGAVACGVGLKQVC